MGEGIVVFGMAFIVIMLLSGDELLKYYASIRRCLRAQTDGQPKTDTLNVVQIPAYVAVFSRKNGSILCEVLCLRGGNKHTAYTWMSNFRVDYQQGVVIVPYGLLRTESDEHKGLYNFVTTEDIKVQFQDGSTPDEHCTVTTQGSVVFCWGEHGVSRSMPIPMRGIDY